MVTQLITRRNLARWSISDDCVRYQYHRAWQAQPCSMVKAAFTISGDEFQNMQKGHNLTREQVNANQNMIEENRILWNKTRMMLAPKKIFEVKRYNEESTKVNHASHVITFEEASYNMGNAMDVERGKYADT